MLRVLIFASLIVGGWSACSSDAISWNQKCYVLYTNQSEFVTAEYFCKSQNGDLVSIHDAFTNQLLTDYVTSHISNVFNRDFWTGGSKMFDPNNWTWADGSSFSYTVWDLNEPRNSSWAKCIGVYSPGGKWSTLDCTTKRPFFCQFPSS